MESFILFAISFLGNEEVQNFLKGYLAEKGLDGGINILFNKFRKKKSLSLEEELFDVLNRSLKDTCEYFKWEYDEKAIFETFVSAYQESWQAVNEYVEDTKKYKQILSNAIGRDVDDTIFQIWCFFIDKHISNKEYQHLHSFLLSKNINILNVNLNIVAEKLGVLNAQMNVIEEWQSRTNDNLDDINKKINGILNKKSSESITDIRIEHFNYGAEENAGDFFSLFQKAAERQYDNLIKKGNKFFNLNVVSDIFPEAYISDVDCVGYDESRQARPVLKHIEQYATDNIMLIGEGGIGKTTLLFHIMDSYYHGITGFTQVPLYIELNRCSSDLSSWCFDNYNSVFIEKNIAALMNDVKYVSKNHDMIEQIQHEFRKKPTNGIPKYLILLDGLNEVTTRNENGYLVASVLEKEIADSINKYKNVRFIITSRNKSKIINEIRKIQLIGINEDVVQSYLKEEAEKGIIKYDTFDKVLKNSELMQCLKVPLFLNMFGMIFDKTEITTRGEILREFFFKKRASLYSRKIEGSRYNSFVLDYIIPEIAWTMVKKDVFYLTIDTVEDIIMKVLMDGDYSLVLNKHARKCFKMEESPINIRNELCNTYGKDEILQNIIDIFCNNLAIIYEEEGEFKFKHHYFRDYFSAIHIINNAKMGVYLKKNMGNAQYYFDDLINCRLYEYTLRFVSEVLGVHHSNPYYKEGQGWVGRSWNEDNQLIPMILNAFRYQFDGSVGNAIWNMVQILDVAGMGLLGINLSNLDLRNIHFNNIVCGIGLRENATRFENSLVDFSCFFPISHYDIVKGAYYSDNGQYILTLSDNRIIIWSTTYDYIRKFDVCSRIIKAIFLEDSSTVACFDDEYNIIIWNMWMEECYISPSINGPIRDICRGDSENCIFVAFLDGTIKRFFISTRVWDDIMRCPINSIMQLMYDVQHQQLVVSDAEGSIYYGKELDGDFDKVLCHVKYFAQAGDGIITVSVDYDDCIKIRRYEEEKNIIHCCKKITDIAISRDGEYLAIIDEETVLHIINLIDNQPKRPLVCTQRITSVSFSDDNNFIITTSGDNFARLWEIKSNVGVCIRPLGDIADWIRNGCYSPDGKSIATSSIDATGKIWDAETGIMKSLLFGHKERVTSVTYDHTGDKVVTTSDDCTSKIWNVLSSRCMCTLKNNDYFVHNAVFDLDDKKLATVSWDTTGTIWILNEKNASILLEGHTAPVHTILFDPSYRMLITSSNDNRALLWNAETGDMIDLGIRHEDRLNSASFSPDGNYIITSSYDKTAKIWNAKTGCFIKSLEGHNDSVRSAVFSPDGNYIATVSRDGVGKLWDGHTFEWKKDLKGHTFFVRSAMFDGKSEKLVTVSYDGSIREWSMEGICTNVINVIPGVFICGCDFSNIKKDSLCTEEQRQYFITHGARVNNV